MAMSGLIGGFIFTLQLNLQEVLRWDRFQHCTLSAVIFLGFFWVLGSVKYRFSLALSAAFAVGVFKELSDHQAQAFDMFANLTGLMIGFMLILIWQNFNRLGSRRSL